MMKANSPRRGGEVHRAVTQHHDLVTVTEAAAYLLVCTKTVRTLVAKGTLPHSRVGKQIRITKSSLNTYLGLGRK